MEEFGSIRKIDMLSQFNQFHMEVATDTDFFAPHRHSAIEIIYLFSGEAVHFVDGTAYEMHRGDMLIVNFGQIHAQRPIEPCKMAVISVAPPFLSDEFVNTDNIMDLLRVFGCSGDEDLEIYQTPKASFEGASMWEVEYTLRQMHTEYIEKKMGYLVMLRSFINILFTYIFRQYKLQPISELPDIVKIVLDYINQFYNRRLRISDLAEQCFYNSHYLGHVFKEAYGISINHYIHQRRVQAAADMLLYTDKTVEDICISVGYREKKKFYQMFKEYQKMTPLEYRRQHEKSKGAQAI